MTLAIAGFQRGSRIVVPTGLSAERAEYFIPSSLAGLRIAHGPAPDDAPWSPPLSLRIPGAWMLSESRRQGSGAVADLAAERTRHAIGRLARTPLTYRTMMEAAALLLGRPVEHLLRDAIA